MSDHLPEEVFLEILSRLPVRALFRFWRVCKTWCCLISSPHFITIYLNRSLSKPRQPQYCLIHHLDFFSQTGSKNVGKLDKLQILAGSSNGTLRLTSDPDYRLYVLWNPSIHKAIALPQPHVGIKSSLPSVGSLGIGYVPQSDDYTLVRLYSHRIIEGRNYKIRRRGEIYSLPSRVWLNSIDVSRQFSQMAQVHWLTHGCTM